MIPPVYYEALENQYLGLPAFSLEAHRYGDGGLEDQRAKRLSLCEAIDACHHNLSPKQRAVFDPIRATSIEQALQLRLKMKGRYS